MQIFDTNYSITINAPILIIVSIILSILIIGLIIYIISLYRKLKTYQTPRYGFLGKSLYPVLLMIVMVGTIFGINSSFLKDTGIIDIKADKNLELEIKTNVIDEINGNYVINFVAIPTLNSNEWGEKEDKFDIIWNIDGIESYNQFEVGKSIDDQSGFLLTLPKGDYTVKIIVVHQGDVFEFVQNVTY
jgi:hypothetical protein